MQNEQEQNSTQGNDSSVILTSGSMENVQEPEAATSTIIPHKAFGKKSLQSKTLKMREANEQRLGDHLQNKTEITLKNKLEEKMLLL